MSHPKRTITFKIKSNANYTCQECGATEFIQAHHEIPGDDDSLIVLCGECHSRKHPKIARALFFSKSSQPYWHNKAASTLAKELGVHSRTIIRAAKRLEIMPGELSSKDEQAIKVGIPKLNGYPSMRGIKKKPCTWCEQKQEYPTHCPLLMLLYHLQNIPVM